MVTELVCKVHHEGPLFISLLGFQVAHNNYRGHLKDVPGEEMRAMWFELCNHMTIRGKFHPLLHSDFKDVFNRILQLNSNDLYRVHRTRWIFAKPNNCNHKCHYCEGTIHFGEPMARAEHEDDNVVCWLHAECCSTYDGIYQFYERYHEWLDEDEA